MKRAFLPAAALVLGLTGAAHSEEVSQAFQLTDAQMDQVTAGHIAPVHFFLIHPFVFVGHSSSFAFSFAVAGGFGHTLVIDHSHIIQVSLP